MSEERNKKARRWDGKILGISREARFTVYRRGALALVFAALIWSWFRLRPDRWYTYTDQVSFQKVARDVTPGYVLWEKARPVETDAVHDAAITSDGARMVYSAEGEDGNADLVMRLWDGVKWGEPIRQRALGSRFREVAPAITGDGKYLYFASDRPGGPGGYDIWVAKWDGAEYAWPLPLTNRVNSRFDEFDPAPAPDNSVLYFTSNRPRDLGGRTESKLERDEVGRLKADLDLYSADLATETPYEVLVERQLSMLYSLREGALADKEVMAKLGGTEETEKAVDRALAYLAATQEEDGRWDLGNNGGAKGHDMAATAFAVLAFAGRGQRHDLPCTYRDNVRRAKDWMIRVQNGGTGDLRGARPQGNGMYDHGVGTLALVELYGVTKDSTIRPRAQAAIDFIADAQHEEGGWRYKPKDAGDLSVTGWMIMALASAQMSGLDVPERTLKGARRFLRSVSGGKNGGVYGYTAPFKGSRSKSKAMGAVGFFCSQLLGMSSNSAQAYESAAEVGGNGIEIGDLYYAYYGTLASYQHQGPLWRAWMEKMRDGFVKMQAGDGSWSASGGHGGQMGKTIATAIVALCLEAHYRYTPLYGLGYEPDPAGPSKNVLEAGALPETPLFRHAKLREELSSAADEKGPVVTDHGDFLYFASAREGGEGGLDLYRSRISGETPTPPENVGPEINSSADEWAPAVRMAGFNILFNSNRDGGRPALFASTAQRLERRFDYSKLPPSAWMVANLPWLIGLVVTLGLLAWTTRRALKAEPKHG